MAHGSLCYLFEYDEEMPFFVGNRMSQIISFMPLQNQMSLLSQDAMRDSVSDKLGR